MMLTQALLFAVGLLGLYLGAEWLVRGAARLARSLGVSPLVIGLTVVAFGTSTPELVVSALATIRDQSNVAVGNVVGSNILNVALILGIAALIHPLRVEVRLVAREVPIMILASIGVAALALGGSIGRLEGTGMVGALVIYLVFVIRASLRESAAAQAEFQEFEAARTLEPYGESRLKDALLVTVGVGSLVIGGHLLVGAAIHFARAIGVSELTIGLTIVAIGTSLPELATSIVSAIRQEADIALGNIVGSNIFNLLGILGVAALIRPIAFSADVLLVDIPIMVAFSIVLLPLAWTRMRLDRWEGALLVSGYVAFTLLLFSRFDGSGI